MQANIIRYDLADELQMITDDTLTTYLEDVTEYSRIFMKGSLKPSNSWAIPFVTNHRYKVHWAGGLDFTQMKMEVSERW